MEDIILIIVLYFIGTLVADQAKRKKRKERREREQTQEDSLGDIFGLDLPSSTQQESKPNFEIPKIAGAPKSKPEPGADGVYREEDTQEVNKYQEYLNRRSNAEPKNMREKTSLKVIEATKEQLTLSREKVREGIVLAEILGKPKAYKRR